MVEAVLTGMLIFFARVTDVSLGTMRMLMLVKGRRLQAAAFGFFEAMIYVVALSRVVTQLNRWEYVLVYALGFASGNFLGVFLEERMALGYAGVEIIVRSESDALVQKLREEGFGVTVGEGWQEGQGHSHGDVPRRQMPKLMELVRSHDKRPLPSSWMPAKPWAGLPPAKIK